MEQVCSSRDWTGGMTLALDNKLIETATRRLVAEFYLKQV